MYKRTSAKFEFNYATNFWACVNVPVRKLVFTPNKCVCKLSPTSCCNPFFLFVFEKRFRTMNKLKRSLSLRSSKRHIPESVRPQIWENDSYKVRNGGVSFPVKVRSSLRASFCCTLGLQACRGSLIWKLYEENQFLVNWWRIVGLIVCWIHRSYWIKRDTSLRRSFSKDERGRFIGRFFKFRTDFIKTETGSSSAEALCELIVSLQRRIGVLGQAADR